MTRSADLRYRGQAHQLTVPMPEAHHDVPTLVAAFRYAYRRAYGIASDAPAEFVSARVRITRSAGGEQPPAAEPVAPTPAVADGAWPVRFAGTGRFRETPVYEWARLGPARHSTDRRW